MAKLVERVEIITGCERRRRYAAEEKVRLVEETTQPGMTVFAVARLHGISPSLLFGWRRRLSALPTSRRRIAQARWPKVAWRRSEPTRLDSNAVQGPGQPSPRARDEGPRAGAPARSQDDGDRDPQRGAGAGPPPKTRLALAVAATGRFAAKAVVGTLGVARSNLVVQLRHLERGRRGPCRRAGEDEFLAEIRAIADEASDLWLSPRHGAAEPRQAGLRRASP